MERLTKEQLENYRNTYDKFDGVESNIFEEICNELIEYKSLEEELGIDLLTLFKAINSKSIWIKSYRIIEHIEDEYNDRVWRLQDGHLYMYWEDGSHCCLEISNYGKSWSLRKEDLEDEKEN